MTLNPQTLCLLRIESLGLLQVHGCHSSLNDHLSLRHLLLKTYIFLLWFCFKFHSSQECVRSMWRKYIV